MSLTFFRALDRLLRMASALHPVIWAISSLSYSSTSFIRMMVRWSGGSESMIARINFTSSFSSSRWSGVLPPATVCSWSMELLSLLRRHWSIQPLCIRVMANASTLRYWSSSSRLFHSLSRTSCTASSASSGLSVSLRA